MKQKKRWQIVIGVLIGMLWWSSTSLSFAEERYDNSYKVRIGLHYASSAKTSYNLNMTHPTLEYSSVPLLSSPRTLKKAIYQTIAVGNGYQSEEQARAAVNLNGGFICYYEGLYYEAALGSKTYWKVVNAVVVKDDTDIVFAFVPKRDLVLSSGENKFAINRRNYRGSLELVASKGRLTAINYIGLQDYLYGVIPKEIQSNWEMEALKAQAISSRNFTIRNRNKFSKYGFDLDTTTNSQVYGGLDAEHKRTNSAVDATDGELGYYEDEIADLFFFAESGGRTESSQNIWGSHKPYLVGVDDPYSLGGSYANWKFSISKSNLESKLAKAGHKIGSINEIVIEERTENDRVKVLAIHGSAGTKRFRKEEFRRMLGTTQLKSMYFDIAGAQRQTEDELEGVFYELEDVLEGKPAVHSTSSAVNFRQSEMITLLGHGYGHCVGMSQYGAHKMAQQGKDYKQIIAHYFQGVEVR